MFLVNLETIKSQSDPQFILDLLSNAMRQSGFSSLLLTRIPLPGRTADGLVLIDNWDKTPFQIDHSSLFEIDDPVLRMAASLCKPRVFSIREIPERMRASPLINAIAEEDYNSIAVFQLGIEAGHQFALIAAGRDIIIDDQILWELEHFGDAVIQRLEDLSLFGKQRPGELSPREKTVLTLTADGKTASDIAILLEISQRTVHAHLQNSADKLNAANKTQTVVEALRYAQVQL